MLENFFNKINQTVDAKRNETPSSMAPTLKKAVELKPEDLEPVAQASPSEKAPTIKVLKPEDLEPVVGPSEKAPTIKLMKPEDVTELVDEDKDVHGPLEKMGAETLPHQEAQTLKTDATVALEKQAKAERAPTVRTPESIELKAAEAQTFKTGETIAREEEAKDVAHEQYQAKIAQEKGTLRKMAEGYMEYDAIHNRVTEWLKTLDEMLATPQSMEELIKLKADALKAKEAIESQLNLEQYGIAKSEPGATPFTVEVPAEWPQIEARLNEIKESIKAGQTIREPKQMPTIREEQKFDKAA